MTPQALNKGFCPRYAGQALCGFSLILRISASASQWTLQFQRERQRKPFSQACKHPRDFSHADGVKSFQLRGSQSSPSNLRNMHGTAEAHHPRWEDATSSVGRSREYSAGNLSAARCFKAAGRGSTICNVDNLSLVAPQGVSLGGPPVLFSRKRLPGVCRTFLAECSHHLRHDSKLMQATTRTHTFHSHVCRIFNCDPLKRALRQDRKRCRCDCVFEKRPFCSGQRGGERHTGDVVYRGVTRPHPAVRRSG